MFQLATILILLIDEFLSFTRVHRSHHTSHLLLIY